MADEEENSAVASEGNAQEQNGQGSSDAKEENGAGLIQSLFYAGNKLLT